MTTLRICSNKGLHLTFDNGWTISIQIGYANYADNYTIPKSAENDYVSTTAEIAIWNKDGQWKRLGPNDDIKAYVPIDVVIDMINQVRDTKP